MKLLQLTLISIFSVTNFFAQTDSTSFVNANWQLTRIAKGICLKQHGFVQNIFQSNQMVSILEIKPKRKTKFAFGFEEKALQNTTDFGIKAKAIAAINGTFFDIKNGGSVDFLQVDNRIINQNQLSKNKRAIHQKSAIVISNGKVGIKKWDDTENWENKLPYSDIMVTGPLLLLKNKIQELDTVAFNKKRHPRSIVAKTKNGKILLLSHSLKTHFLSF